ncbi:MAG: hypothetical protein IJ373_01590, partial [Clostridia bacterium]|nr:hypothetical protein [Clostridia bacterium]
DATRLWNHAWNSYYFTDGGQPEGAYAEDVAAPKGFNYVSYYSWTSTTSNDFPVTGHLNGSDISAYSDLWFAMKVVNGTDIYVQGADAYTGGDWLYVHMKQADDATWTKTFSSPDGYSATQTGLTDTLFDDLMQWKSGVNRGSYPRLDKTAGLTATAYFTDVLAIKKDGSAITAPAAPDYAADSKEFDPEIPASAVSVRAYPWRDDRYTDGTITYTIGSADAPAGYANVLQHTYSSTRTYEYTYCFDTTLDITQYSDLYLATKMENGTHIYVKNGSGHYTGSNWLYVHYQQVSTGVWQASFKAADGYETTASATISATTIKALIDGNLYGHAASAGMGTITYWTEILGVSAAQGERAIFSAVDGAAKTKDGIGIPVGFTSTYKYENFTADKFAALSLENTKYDTLSFGMIADKDFIFNAGYKYTMPGEDTERPTTSIMYNTGSRPQMYVVNLANNRDGSWTVTMNVKRWVSAPAAGGSSAQIADTETFTATVEGSSLQTIMGTILTPANGLTLYVTEVRGTHTCAYNNTKSLGNGYLQDYCICGETIGDPVEFAHGIANEAVMANDSIWRDNNYALSTPDQVAPAGFENIEMYRWNLNSVIVNGVPYGSTANDMPLTCLDEADVSAYDEVWFAMKNVGGTGFYVRNASKYTGNDWLYFHLVKVDGAWTLSLSSPDGYVAENVQTGIVGNTLKDILQYHGATDAEPWNSGAYPTKEVGDTTTDVKIYFTEILGIIGCDHTAGVNYVSNGDGTHNEVCANCAAVITEDVTCSGG